MATAAGIVTLRTSTLREAQAVPPLLLLVHRFLEEQLARELALIDGAPIYRMRRMSAREQAKREARARHEALIASTSAKESITLALKDWSVCVGPLVGTIPRNGCTRGCVNRRVSLCSEKGAPYMGTWLKSANL